MPAPLTYPGVYIEEVPSGVRTITGVATSLAAFVGFTAKGPPDKAVPITSYADFEREYGGLHRDSPLSYAVRQFYANGGAQALIVRVATGYSNSKWQLSSGGGAAVGVLEVEAASPGAWSKEMRLTVTHEDARNPHSEFNLTVLQLQGEGLPPATLEVHRNLNMNKDSAHYAPAVVNNASAKIRLTRTEGLAFNKKGFAVSGVIAFELATTNAVIAGALNGGVPFQVTVAGSPWANIGALVTATNEALAAAGLGAALKASKSGQDGTGNGNHLKLTSETAGEASKVTIAGGAFGSLAALIKMGTANGGREINGDAQFRPDVAASVLPASIGVDGSRGGANDLIGSPSHKTGMQALLDADLFNILSIPETFDMSDEHANSVIGAGTALCEARRAFFIVDAPTSKNLGSVANWAQSASLSRNAATYFPAVRIADPLDNLRHRAMPPSGTIAGIYARTDSTRGVWKAPAGTDATMKGVADLSVTMNDLENGQLNTRGVNVLRSFPDHGRVVWGARTRRGSDAQADEYKYVPVRRLALFIEESLYRGTQWVVFEPNDEPLWAQIRLNIGAFMQNLFRQGAFQGRSPREAYFVKCDRETTTQNDINLGIVNIHVGFAPLKPAEFVVIKLQQMAGQVEA